MVRISAMISVVSSETRLIHGMMVEFKMAKELVMEVFRKELLK